ncbi:MAG: hypothetical protein L6Q71_08770 [Planctomycetes bacterium]|nr:hypothetical protein [Planctomycetota bacterium]NUQ36005.1 hypothetical protein [Planctomycetaceae bacterium]
MAYAPLEYLWGGSPWREEIEPRLEQLEFFLAVGKHDIALHTLPIFMFDPKTRLHIAQQLGMTPAESDDCPPVVLDLIGRIHSLVGFYVCWDTFNYAGASAFSLSDDLPEEHLRFAPTKEQQEWVVRLSQIDAQPVERAIQAELVNNTAIRDDFRAFCSAGDMTMGAENLRRLAADLYANGIRRLQDLHREDALIRAYRCYGLIVEARLLDQSISLYGLKDSSHPVVQARLRNDKSFAANVEVNGKPTLMQQLGLLKSCRDPFWSILKWFMARSIFPAPGHLCSLEYDTRTSILLEGIRESRSSEASGTVALYEQLYNVLVGDNPDYGAQWLQLAQFKSYTK